MQQNTLDSGKSLSTLHRFQVNLQRRIYGHDTGVAVHPLNPEKAVQAASDLLGEFIIFAVGGTIVILEVQRSSRSEALKEAKMRAELDALRERDNCAFYEIKQLTLRIEELEKSPKNGRAIWRPSSFGTSSNIKDISKEIQTLRQREGVSPPNQTNTTDKTPQN
ncbi:uncharacterized protein [Physcomitrium patens]|uniref:uncharacterized protein isoform X2 n=1 Tax=Physcomitrium patens TaxID=3218 RepID=UPI000D17755F|nr:optic atrophy 3 protein homolog isoform X2 [Physcomitrium patens]|eukprot:XP_024369886.1 optic atrophy 3 protein homolog isoform X2 [Physcomitrella patens]